jgi:CBS domain containing-hemolysin-like protein
MSPLIQIVIACLVFLIGLRLSAFFSGSETGFYRASYLRITIDAQAGDKTANWLLWFARHPSAFVATTLVGNNVANLVIALAVGMGAAAIFQTGAEWLKVAAVLVFVPVVFVCGKLLPKTLYYRAPLMLMRGDVRWLVGFYYLFLPVSFPLRLISNLFERLRQTEANGVGRLPDKSRLAQVLSQGQREGLLTDVQSRLIRGVMGVAGHSVQSSMTPSDRVLGVAEKTLRKDVLEFARNYGITIVPVRRKDDPHGWFAYVRVVDLAVAKKTVSSLMENMPEIPAHWGKLEALLHLREMEKDCGIVKDGPKVLGVISAHGLVEQLFRPLK